jgi:hypothetical protein
MDGFPRLTLRSQFGDGAKPISFRGSFRTAPGVPKSIRERCNILLFGFVGDRVDAIRGAGILMLFLCV